MNSFGGDIHATFSFSSRGCIGFVTFFVLCMSSFHRNLPVILSMSEKPSDPNGGSEIAPENQQQSR